jgi:hypothetical protein
MLWWLGIFYWRSGRATQSKGCPVPEGGTGRYKFNGNFKGAQLKLAATESKAELFHELGFEWLERGVRRLEKKAVASG